MRKIKLICDSSCDLDFEYAKELGIDIEPLRISFNTDKSYKDMVDINVEMLYEKVKQYNKTPKTAAMTPNEYYNLFKNYLAQGYDIIYTGIGSGFSSSYNTGYLTSLDIDPERIEVVDSKNLSTGIALILFKALEWIEEGLDVHEVASRMRKQANLIRSQFAIDTMEFLHKGGRCSGMVKLLGTVLKIKPIIGVRDNEMVVIGKPRGKINVAIDMMLKMAEDEKDNVDQDIITITHSKADSYVLYTKEKLENMFPNAKILVTNAGCIVSSHCGPNTLGIFYSLKEEK
jgi:DegV family protein with EDD domain